MFSASILVVCLNLRYQACFEKGKELVSDSRGERDNVVWHAGCVCVFCMVCAVCVVCSIQCSSAGCLCGVYL